LRVNLLSVSALEDVGYCTLFKRGHVFIYKEGVDPVEPQLIGDQVDRLYMLRGQPSGYDSASDEEQEAPETTMGPRIQSCIPREERESLLSTGRRLSWCDRMMLRVEWILLGAQATANNVMGPDDGDGSEYIPR
jgi:hypothetical protein